MNEIIKELVKMGLTDKESAIYLALLELGSAPVQEISDKSNVNRATAYLMLDSLFERGLVGSFEKDKKRYFIAESPERFLKLLQKEKQKLAEKEESISKILPTLAALHNIDPNKPNVMFFEGLDGLRKVQQEVENAKGDFFSITNIDEARAIYATEPEVSQSHAKRLGKSNVSGRGLYISSKSPEHWIEKFSAGFKREFRFLPFDKFPIYGEIDVRGDSIVLFSFKVSILAVLIRSQVIADTLHCLFEIAWNSAAKDYSVFEKE